MIKLGVSLRKQEYFTIRNSLIESTILTGPKHIVISIVVENFSRQFKHLQFKKSGTPNRSNFFKHDQNFEPKIYCTLCPYGYDFPQTFHLESEEGRRCLTSQFYLTLPWRSCTASALWPQATCDS